MKRAIVALSIVMEMVCSAAQAAPQAGPVPVKLEKKADGGWQLVREGQPYFIKGFGWTCPDVKGIKEMGGNSVRNWGGASTPALLDMAQKEGITVAVGLWMMFESEFSVDDSDVALRYDFNYKDPAKVEQQEETLLLEVEKYKDHPSVLVWGVGNEVPFNSRNWKEVLVATNSLAKKIKALDPNHPTMAVICRLNADILKLYKECCPDVDILGINGYHELTSIMGRLKAANFDRPFLLSEFGMDGPWEVDHTPWKKPLEPTSSEKAAHYKRTYEAVVKDNPLCLGAYAFMWSDDPKEDWSWYNMMLPGKVRTESLDVLQRFWTGKEPANRAPIIKDSGISVTFDGGTYSKRWAEYPPGAKLEVEIKAEDPDGDKLEAEWKLVTGEAARYYPGAPIVTQKGLKTTIAIPLGKATTLYRIVVTVTDGNNNGATASMPIRVSRYYNP